METKENSSSLTFEQRACITKKEKKQKKKREKKQKAKREKAKKKKKKIKLMFIPAGVCVFRWIYEYLESLSNKHAFLMQKQ